MLKVGVPRWTVFTVPAGSPPERSSATTPAITTSATTAASVTQRGIPARARSQSGSEGPNSGRTRPGDERGGLDIGPESRRAAAGGAGASRSRSCAVPLALLGSLAVLARLVRGLPLRPRLGPRDAARQQGVQRALRREEELAPV